MSAFPAYAEILLDGFSEQPNSAVLRAESEDGFAKQSQRFSRVLVKRPITARIKTLANLAATIIHNTLHVHTGFSEVTIGCVNSRHIVVCCHPHVDGNGLCGEHQITPTTPEIKHTFNALHVLNDGW